jgi:DnaJ like chaperone protein
LSSQDDRLSSLYKEARRVRPEIGNSQREWLRERDQCGSPECISAAYSNREAALNAVLKPANVGANAASSDVAVATVPIHSDDNSLSKEVAPDTQGIPVATRNAHGKDGIRWGSVVGIVFIGIIIIGMVMHGKRKVSVFENYTDLSQFLILPVLILAFGKLIGHVFASGLAEELTYAITGFVYALWNGHVCLRANERYLIAILVFLVRFVLGAILAICFIGAVDRPGSSRRNGESATAYELRLRRESMQEKRRTVFFLALIAILASFSVRNRGFVSLSSYWHGSNEEGGWEEQEPYEEELEEGLDDGAAGYMQSAWQEVLGVAADASKEEVVAAYKRSIREYHPDKVMSMGAEIRKVAERKSKEINDAYETAMKSFS